MGVKKDHRILVYPTNGSIAIDDEGNTFIMQCPDYMENGLTNGKWVSLFKGDPSEPVGKLLLVSGT